MRVITLNDEIKGVKDYIKSLITRQERDTMSDEEKTAIEVSRKWSLVSLRSVSYREKGILLQAVSGRIMRRRRTGTIKAENRVVWILCLLLGFAISVLSCAGDGSTLDPQGNPLGPPQIQVAPGQVSLSLTQETVDTVSVTVTNVGGFPLTVLSVSSDVPWATTLVASKALGQDESLEILIRIDATDIPLGSSEGTLTILSDDAESPSETIAIVPDRHRDAAAGDKCYPP